MKEIRGALRRKVLAAFSKKADGGGDPWEVRGSDDGDDGGEEKARPTDSDSGGPGSSEQTLADSFTHSGDGGEFAAATAAEPPSTELPPFPDAPSGEWDESPSAAPAAAPAAAAAPAPARTRRRREARPEVRPEVVLSGDDIDSGNEGGGGGEPFEGGRRESRARQIRLMRIAAETLQKRASEAERKEKERRRAEKAEEAKRLASRWKERKELAASLESGISQDGSDNSQYDTSTAGSNGLEERGGEECADCDDDCSEPFSEDGSIGGRPWLEEIDLWREGGGERIRRQNQQQQQHQHQHQHQQQKPPRQKDPSGGGKRKGKEPRPNSKGKGREGRRASEGRRRGSREEEERSERTTRRGNVAKSEGGRRRSGSGKRRGTTRKRHFGNERRERKWKRHPFSLGQRAEPCHVDAPSSFADALVKIARLQKGDGAWVRRTRGGGGRGGGGDGDRDGNGDVDGHVWTYAILKKRSENSLVFIMNERGSSKECSVKTWTKFVRVVAPGYALKEEEEDRQEALDAFVGKGSDGPGSGRADPSNGGKRPASVSGREAGRNEETGGRDDPPGEARVEAGEGETDGRADPSSEGEGPAPVPDHDVSMYTLGWEGDAAPAVIMQDHETSAYSLVGDGVYEDDATTESSIGRAEPSSGGAEPSTGEEKPAPIPNHDASMYTLGCEGGAPPVVVPQDHELSMYTLVGNGVDEDGPSSSNDRVPDDHNISVAEHDHDISMCTLRHRVRAAAAEDPPGAASVAGLPSTSAAGRGRGAPAKKPRGKAREAAADRPPGDIGGKAGERRAVRRLSKSLPAARSPTPIPVERRRAARRLSKSLPPVTSPTAVSESPEEETGTRSERVGKRRPGGLSAHDVGGKAEKKRADRQLSESLLPAASSTPASELPEEENGTRAEHVGKGRPEELRPPTSTGRSDSEGFEAKKTRAVQQGRDVPTSADGLVGTKKNRKKPSRRATGVQQLSKSLLPTQRVSFSASCKDGTSMGLDSLRKKPTKVTTQLVETDTPNNEADFSSSTMTATQSISSIFGHPAKEHAEQKPARHDDDANKDKHDTSSRNNEYGATMKDHNVSMYTLDGGDAALLSSADSTILLLESVSKQGNDVLAYVPRGSVVLTKTDGTRTLPAAADSGIKVETNHATLQELYESLRGLVGRSSSSGNETDDRTLRDANVSGHTLDRGDSLILSSAGTTILLVEFTSERGRDILAYAPCGAVVATKKSHEATPWAATDRPNARGSQVEMKRAVELLSESLDHIKPPMFDLEEEASTRQGSMRKKLAEELPTANGFICQLSASLSSTPPISISESSSEGKTGAPVNESEISSRALPIKSSCSPNNFSSLIEEYETIGEHQQPSQDDEEETNSLNDDSDRSRNNRADRIADFRQMCNSIRSESYHRQKRKPKPRVTSRRVSWSGELEK